MKIVVLMKEVPDTFSDRKLDLVTGMLDRAAGELVADEIGERALECALRYRDGGHDVEIGVLTMGPATVAGSLRKALAMGADSATIVADPSLAGADLVRSAHVLAAALTQLKADLVIAGNESTDGRGGMLPAMVAELLGRPALPALDAITIRVDGVDGTASLAGERVSLTATLPAVVSVGESVGEARFPTFMGIKRAKKKPVEVWSLADLDGLVLPEAQSVMVSAVERPAKDAGLKVVDDGTAAEQLADFLAVHRLIPTEPRIH